MPESKSMHSVLDGVHPDNPNPVAIVQIRPPLAIRWIAVALAMLLPTLLLGSLLVPWQQSALGTGQVIAYAPQERQQVVEAPIEGRVVEWFVREGERVAEGAPLVEIRDNDPDLVRRLQEQEKSLQEELRAANEQIASYGRKLEATWASRELQIAELEAKIQETLQKRIGVASEVEAAYLNLNRVRTLTSEGLSSTRDLELATMQDGKTRATLDALDRQVSAQRRANEKAAAEADGKIASVEAELEVARSKAAEVRRKLLELEVKQARQAAQIVRAPREGLVLMLHGAVGGGQVKSGDPVVTLVPDTLSRAVEITIDGNDMPLVRQGGPARIVFEGWPALQVVGLPGTNRGTFDAVVAFVDAAGDAKGRFRVVLVPAPGAIWPDAERLRQGVRAKGFLLLGSVSVGYELWRQINGFPPLPDIDKTKGSIPSAKKPRSPEALK